MCGIVGYISRKVKASDEKVLKMSEIIKSRGPDSFGSWCDTNRGVALAHRRLSILDISSAGYQPMKSHDGRYILVFNGEIYNFKQLKKELTLKYQYTWRGHSDSEVLICLIQSFGVHSALKKINGMFAIAVWDRLENILTLARDRIGEKPLYYGMHNGSFLFGSELKAIKEFEQWQPEVDRNAMCLFLRHGYIPAPWSVYKNIKKLEPGKYVDFSLDSFQIKDAKPFWNLYGFVDNFSNRLDFYEEKYYIDQLESKLKHSVNLRMESDVPLGAFLSGGLDSSMVVALMQSLSIKPINTFTVGFNADDYNEAQHAKAISEYLGTNHTEIYVNPKEALEVVPKLPVVWDEPFADPSQIPTLLISKLAKGSVTVALSGDGGDELFCGYDRYQQGYMINKFIDIFPAIFVKLISKGIRSFPPSLIQYLSNNFLPTKYQYPAIGDRLPKLGEIIKNTDNKQFYKYLVSCISSPEGIVIGGEEPKTILANFKEWPRTLDIKELMMYLDILSYLPGDCLANMDRASMAYGLETRMPFLDHELIEWSWSVPLDMKFRNGNSKWILRKVLSKYIPTNLTERPKMGFSVPIEEWLLSDLKEWAESLLSKDSIDKQGFFDSKKVGKLWSEHKSGHRRFHAQLWSILMASSWAENNL